jgi:DinB superfamily
MSTNTADLTAQLADQLDFHWRTQLRPRLDGLTDDEYFWEPVPGCWSVHRNSSIDFSYPPPQPAPFTTIAWRMAHIIVGVLAMRNHAHFGGPPADYQSWACATDADTALAQLDDTYAHWIAGVRNLDTAGLAQPCGPSEGGMGRPSDVGANLAYQPRGHPPWCRNCQPPRSLRPLSLKPVARRGRLSSLSATGSNRSKTGAGTVQPSV